MGTTPSRNSKGVGGAGTSVTGAAHPAQAPGRAALVVAQPVAAPDPPTDATTDGTAIVSLPSSSSVAAPSVAKPTAKPAADLPARVALEDTPVPADIALPNISDGTLSAHMCVLHHTSNMEDPSADGQAYVESMVARHRLGNRPLTCCSFRGGLCIDVNGRPWASTNVVDEFDMALTWIGALLTVLRHREPHWRLKKAAEVDSAAGAASVPPPGASADDAAAGPAKVSATQAADPPSGDTEAGPVATGAGGNAGAGSSAATVPFDHSGFAADGPLGHVNFADPAQAAAVDWDAVDWDDPKLFEGHEAAADHVPGGAKVAGAWPWEESSLRLARVGPQALAMEDVVHGSRVVLPRVVVDIHDFAAVVHGAMMQLLAWSERVVKCVDVEQQKVDTADGASDNGHEPEDDGSERYRRSEALGIIRQNIPNPASLRKSLADLVVAIQQSCKAVGVPAPTLQLDHGDDPTSNPASASETPAT